MARILIIEDNDVLNKAYELILTHKDYKVATAYDGNEGLISAEKLQPELILLDMLMPNLNGIGFLKAYDSVHLHPEVKILLLTNLGEEKLVKQALALGAHQYFLKANLSPSQLTDIVSQHLKFDIPDF